MKERVKRALKNLLPWRIRYFIKLQEAKGNIGVPERIKQFRGTKEYNDPLYSALEYLGISDFTDKSICELGPGQHLSHALIAYQLGSGSEILLDIADIAHSERPASLEEMKLDAEFKTIRELPGLEGNESWSSYLKKINAKYCINGIDGYRSVPDNSIDYCFSFAVFEHIRKNIFTETMSELYRFLKVGGVGFHTIDFTDHLGGKKNHLRFSESVWEDEDHYKMDNYTNRLSCTEICAVLKDVGFREIRVEKLRSFDDIPIKRKDISIDRKGISDEDLKSAMIALVIRK